MCINAYEIVSMNSEFKFTEKLKIILIYFTQSKQKIYEVS